MERYILSNFKGNNRLLLAEDLGFHIGDGCMMSRKRKGGRFRYDFYYSGDSIKDKDYFIRFLIPRKMKLFDIKNINYSIKKKSEISFSFTCKKLFDFFSSLNIPSGHKKEIFIPKFILSDKPKLWSSFLRGFMDSDGSLSIKKKHKITHYYPVLSFSMKSEKLLDDIEFLLSNLGFNYTKQKRVRFDKRTKKRYRIFQIDINGKKNLRKWVKNINFNNKRHVEKYEKWGDIYTSVKFGCFRDKIFISAIL